MNVTIAGYVNYTCSHCTQVYNIEAKALVFTEDTSAQAEEEDYIRYLTELKTPCQSCGTPMQLGLDVWEHPESIANYAYHSDKGIKAVECELAIEHYFDDAAIQKSRYEAPRKGIYGERNMDDSEDDEEVYNEDTRKEVYKDQYDEEE
ncbi:hypothetical protein [Marinagarivorans algicola]|uniref:hypothetical protein n=1 Tax=Marinagarivorans algicola TaxID=1513270 RepID=UPI0006B99A10|nr:hypothetical protein [Marinagarivorans algicola]